ncbi:hypothetical protein CLIB1423_05S03950 [[Candida] railenensis]|uniref:Uncharacterized protein n=1 Tax=[Candida] railenensis TaxID=45579 RepID=A0A9P0VXY5_9ASCO|nr:hypothetical protein CLIB1423_05S03950 [[Candida] railenensis]
MVHRNVNAFFVVLFALIAYYLAFYSHLEPIEEPRISESEKSIQSKEDFVKEANITHNQFCYLDTKSSLVEFNKTSYYEAIALAEGAELLTNWALCSPCDEGTCIETTPDTKLVVETESLWTEYDESRDYCEERHANALKRLQELVDSRSTLTAPVA